MNELGWTPAVGSYVTPQGLAATLGVVPRYERPLARFLQILSENHFLESAVGGWSVIAPLTAADPLAATEGLLADHSSSRARITLAANCGADLPAILRGEVDPLTRSVPGRLD